MNGLARSLPVRLPPRRGGAHHRPLPAGRRVRTSPPTSGPRCASWAAAAGPSSRSAASGPAWWSVEDVFTGARHEVAERRVVVALDQGGHPRGAAPAPRGQAPLLGVLRLPPARGPPRHPQGGEAPGQGRAARASGPTATNSWRSSPGWRSGSSATATCGSSRSTTSTRPRDDPPSERRPEGGHGLLPPRVRARRDRGRRRQGHRRLRERHGGEPLRLGAGGDSSGRRWRCSSRPGTGAPTRGSVAATTRPRDPVPWGSGWTWRPCARTGASFPPRSACRRCAPERPPGRWRPSAT